MSNAFAPRGFETFEDDFDLDAEFEPGAPAPGLSAAGEIEAPRSPLQFTAPNLQYLMDSPTEFGPLSIRQFDIDGQTFRFSAHHTGTGH